MNQSYSIPKTSIRRVDADGVKVFYREAGPKDAPVVLLLHGFPTSSFQYRELIPRLSDRYRVIAPDLPGFGFTEVPPERNYKYTFEALAATILAFTDALGLKRYALYVFDYGAPTGFPLAMTRPERVTAIVSQNGNAYEEGLGDALGHAAREGVRQHDDTEPRAWHQAHRRPRAGGEGARMAPFDAVLPVVDVPAEAVEARGAGLRIDALHAGRNVRLSERRLVDHLPAVVLAVVEQQPQPLRHVARRRARAARG